MRARRVGRPEAWALPLGALLLLLAACGNRDAAPRAGRPHEDATHEDATHANLQGTEDSAPAHDHEHAQGLPTSGAHVHGDGHAHVHGVHDDPPAEAVPIVRFHEPETEGPHLGIVARLSTADEADFGFAEVKLHGEDGHVEVWLAKDRTFGRPFDVPLDTVVRLTLLDHAERSLELRVRDIDRNADESDLATIRAGRTNYFVGAPPPEAVSWWRRPALRELARLEMRIGVTAYVTDDFELLPHAGGR